jgi:hypothetical protein
MIYKTIIILENTVESTTSGYCTDKLRYFDDFLLHRMGDTLSAKNHQNISIILKWVASGFFANPNNNSPSVIAEMLSSDIGKETTLLRTLSTPLIK